MHACVRLCVCTPVCVLCEPASVRPVSLPLLCLRFCVQTTEKAGSGCAILTQPISRSVCKQTPRTCSLASPAAPAGAAAGQPLPILPALPAHFFSCKGRCWQSQGGARRNRKGGDTPCRASRPDPMRPQPHQCMLYTLTKPAHSPNPAHPTRCHQALCLHHPRLGPPASLWSAPLTPARRVSKCKADLIAPRLSPQPFRVAG